MILHQVTTVEAGEAFGRSPLGVITCGATEQHGPHLPLSTDTIGGWALARKVAARMDCVLTPPIPVGCSDYHLKWPGTLSISPATMTSMICEIAESLQTHGVKNILIVNGHGGNRSAVDVAASQLVRTGGVSVVVAYFQGLAFKAAGGEMDLGHAGHVETAVVLREAPELVKMELATGGTDLAEALRREREFSARDIYRPMLDWASVSESGWFGDAAAATAEQADPLLEKMADRVVEYVSSALVK